MISRKPIEEIAKNFIPKEFIKNRKDSFFYQNKKEGKVKCRKLYANEIEILIKNNNFAEDWNEILVTDQFDPNLVKNCEFFGRVTIGKLTPLFLEHHDLRLPVGISNSTIISCDVGDNVVIRDVHYLAHYIIGNNCILFNIDEMITTDHAKFGNGILKEGEDENLRVWVEVGNENEGRKVLPFEDMIPADAYIWSKYRSDKKLMKKLIDITEKDFDKKRGHYGTIGQNTVIKNCSIVKDVKTGECAYIKGANKIKNITVLSSKEEPSQIGEGVEVVNGIMGYGSRIFYGSKAVRFVMGRNTQLKYGARLINSVLGDNSTVSCCELLNNLIFPFHEQHHNTSFLIASTIFGQSNIAAGATIGSNHNSRSPDGEIIAGRGFWPGLCTNFKHNSYFASFVLVAKGNYLYELNIKYPFSLVSLDKKNDAVNILPAYWFKYNMYALARNNNKFRTRDKRKIKVQKIEVDCFAPDTISEVLGAITRVELLIGEQLLEREAAKKRTTRELINVGKEYISKKNSKELEVFDPLAMKKYGGKIVKPLQAVKEYKKMCIYFIIENFIKIEDKIDYKKLTEKIKDIYKKQLYTRWKNIGGQIIPEEELEKIKDDIKNGALKTWREIHARYDREWTKYKEQKTRYAIYVLESVYEKEIKKFEKEDWENFYSDSLKVVNDVYELSIESRAKDYTDYYRKMVYDNEKEMIAVLGKTSENDFLNELKIETNKKSKILKNIISSI